MEAIRFIFNYIIKSLILGNLKYFYFVIQPIFNYINQLVN